MRYISEKTQAFGSIQTRTQVKMHEVQLRRNARVIDELDVVLGFASFAADMHFTRPIIKNECVGLWRDWSM